MTAGFTAGAGAGGVATAGRRVGAGAGAGAGAAGALGSAGICTGATAGADVGAGAGFGDAGAGGVTRRMTIGFGRSGATWTMCAACTTGRTGAIETRNVGPGAGSGCARTIAGCDAVAGSANEGVCPPPGPANMRGNATAPATAPASSTAATTPLVIALMVPTPDADGITRSRYRQVGTRA